MEGSYKLRIKPNLPGSSSSNGGEAAASPSPFLTSSRSRSDEEGEVRHRCNTCNRGFSSGKALRGHMRQHYQGDDRDNDNVDLFIDDDEEKNKKKKSICGICGKDFYSKKALYGHMRSHPERPWRGMQPPTTITTPPSSASSSATIDGSSFVDSSISLPRWSLTARRGRKSTASASNSEDANTKASDVIDNYDHVAGSSSNRKVHLETTKRRKFKIDELCDAIDTHFDHMGSVKRKMQFDEEEKEVILRKVEYKCNLCTKSFSSPQALGGHKSSHYKPNKTEVVQQEAQSDQTGRRVLDFDLNELPPLDDGEGLSI